jgi:hypothetical protein
MKGKVFLFIAVIMIIVGGIAANLVQNDFYQVKVRDVRFAAADGSIMSALLFIPKNATPQTPVPGILTVHGYINSRAVAGSFWKSIRAGTDIAILRLSPTVTAVYPAWPISAALISSIRTKSAWWDIPWVDGQVSPRRWLIPTTIRQ